VATPRADGARPDGVRPSAAGEDSPADPARFEDAFANPLAALPGPALDEPAGAKKTDAVQLFPDAAALKKYYREVLKDQWQFYADQVNETTNFLPPDNVRMHGLKVGKVDYQTSPTNIGQYLTCAAAAQKLGFISPADLVTRVRQTLDGLDKLPAYNGTVTDDAGREHPLKLFYNWYATDGQPRQIREHFIPTVDNGNLRMSLMTVLTALGDSAPDLGQRLRNLIEQMRFDAVYDPEKGLLYHGGNVDDDGCLVPTKGHFDMILTEARSAVATGVMMGELPRSTWSHMKRKLGKEFPTANSNPALEFQAYTGTMFEYLMPRLYMKHAGTPLGAVDDKAVQIQMQDAPGGIWGMSEANSPFGYAAFGPEGLSQSREHIKKGVIAPYASQLAAGMAPLAVAKNLKSMEALGLRGTYGFIESCVVDPETQQVEPDSRVQQFFAHHIGMGFLGMANYLLDDVVSDWFHHSEYNRNGTLEGLLSTPASQYRPPDIE